jgi:hypothetical protein
MLGHRSLNLKLIPLDPEIERTSRRNLRTPAKLGICVEMGDRPENAEEARTLRKLFAPIVTNPPFVHSVVYNECYTL